MKKIIACFVFCFSTVAIQAQTDTALHAFYKLYAEIDSPISERVDALSDMFGGSLSTDMAVHPSLGLCLMLLYRASVEVQNDFAVRFYLPIKGDSFWIADTTIDMYGTLGYRKISDSEALVWFQDIEDMIANAYAAKLHEQHGISILGKRLGDSSKPFLLIYIFYNLDDLSSYFLALPHPPRGLA